MTAHDSFWNWFIQHEVELFEFDPNQETERELLFDCLATEIHKVHPDLAFEFGQQGPRREFVVTAAGMRDAVSAVAPPCRRCAGSSAMAIYGFSPTSHGHQRCGD
jgi:hypothetical protein